MICTCYVIVIKSTVIMKCAHYNKFTTEFLSFADFIVIVINTSSYLNIQYHWVGMHPIHLVILNRLSPHTFYTEQSLKIKTKCVRSLSTMRS